MVIFTKRAKDLGFPSKGFGWGIGMKTIETKRKRPRRLCSCVDWQPRALCRGELTDRVAGDSGTILGSDSGISMVISPNKLVINMIYKEVWLE